MTEIPADVLRNNISPQRPHWPGSERLAHGVIGAARCATSEAVGVQPAGRQFRRVSL